MAETYSDQPTLEKWNELAQAAQAGKSPFVKLIDVTVPAATTQYDLDVSGIDWEKWQSVHIDVKAAGSASGIVLYLNGELHANSECSFYPSNSSTRSSLLLSVFRTGDAAWFERITFPVGRVANRRVSAQVSDGAGQSGRTYAMLHTLNILGANLGAMRIVVWGEA